MNRLTCKPDKVMENYYYETTEETINEDRIAILNKLGQLEDIEEELGIDLITLLKGGKFGVWYLSNGALYFRRLDICLADKCFRQYVDFEKRYIKYYFKDYGVTWALTKEELL